MINKFHFKTLPPYLFKKGNVLRPLLNIDPGSEYIKENLESILQKVLWCKIFRDADTEVGQRL